MTPIFNFNISVIIPVYNAEQYIRRAVTSVLDQEEVTEILIVEDGSQDNSQEICLQLAASDKRIIVLQHPGNKNKGVSASRNLGIRACKNEYIAFLDSDDFYLPNRFSRAKLSFGGDNSVDGVYEMVGRQCAVCKITNHSNIQFVEYNNLFESLQPIGEKVWFHIDGLTLKKSSFKKSGYFDETLKTSEDTLLWFKLAISCKLIPGEIQTFVALSQQLSTGLSSHKTQVKKDFIKMLLKLFKYCKTANLNVSRKEVVLKKLFYFALNPASHYQSTGIIRLFLDIIIADPAHVFFKSSSFRLSIGNIFHLNRFYNR